MTEVLRAKSLRRVFGRGDEARAAIDGIDLCIREGEFVSLFGPSGSGKSTLLGVVGGLDRGFQGEVRLHGRDLQSMSDRELSRFRGEQLGFVFQAFHLLDHLSVIDNVMVPFLFTRCTDPTGAAKAALARVGLGDRAKDSTATLSGGQRQRVAIARAIAHEPSLLICDEPTGNLDESTAAQIIEIFSCLHRDKGTTVLCATHDVRIRRVANRLIHMSDGCIREGGEREDP